EKTARLRWKLLAAGDEGKTERRREGVTERFRIDVRYWFPSLSASLCLSVFLSFIHQVSRYLSTRPIDHRGMPKNIPPVKGPIETADDVCLPLSIRRDDAT